jgi:hypothetical protein
VSEKERKEGVANIVMFVNGEKKDMKVEVKKERTTKKAYA